MTDATARITLLGILLLVILLNLPGCGTESTEIYPPVVEITCDYPVGKPRCFVLVWGADTVEAFYDGKLGWWDYDITDQGRVTYVDAPRGSVFAVEACNDQGCEVQVENLR